MQPTNLPPTQQQPVAKRPEQQKPKRSNFLWSALLVVISTTAGFFGGWIGAEGREQNSSTTIEQVQQVVLNESQVLSDLAETAGRSVVSVNVTSRETVSGFFGPQAFLQEGAGTGFIISDDGIVVTNRHVVPEGTTDVSITLSDGTRLDDVDVVGRTNEGSGLDVAFLRVNDAEGSTLTPIKLGDSSAAKVGDRVVAIGNALGQFQNTVTAGIISGFGRSIEAADSSGANPELLLNLLQTDAAISQGNSGGPLVNINGEVIAINTAVAGNGENIGFAIPINDFKGLIDNVLTTGEFAQAYLGVQYRSLTPDLAFELGISQENGAYILTEEEAGNATVIAGSPAEQAGVQPGDIITEVSGTAIDSRNSLASVLGRFKVGDSVALTIIRGSDTITLDATLGRTPE